MINIKILKELTICFKLLCLVKESGMQELALEIQKL